MNNNQKELLNHIGADENTPMNELIKLGEKAGIDILKALNPTNPLLVKEEDRISLDEAKGLLREWAKVRSSVRSSVRASVRSSVRDSVWDSVGVSVGASVWDSVWDWCWDSVRSLTMAYASSIFTHIKKWDGIDHEEGVNPFQSGIDLVEGGYIASFDGNKWRLHAGKDAAVVWEGTIEDLNNKEQSIEKEAFVELEKENEKLKSKTNGSLDFSFSIDEVNLGMRILDYNDVDVDRVNRCLLEIYAILAKTN